MQTIGHMYVLLEGTSLQSQENCCFKQHKDIETSRLLFVTYMTRILCILWFLHHTNVSCKILHKNWYSGKPGSWSATCTPAVPSVRWVRLRVPLHWSLTKGTDTQIFLFIVIYIVTDFYLRVYFKCVTWSLTLHFNNQVKEMLSCSGCNCLFG